jgi:hypothetical protein
MFRRKKAAPEQGPGRPVVGPSADAGPYGVEFEFAGLMVWHPAYGNWGTSYDFGKQELYVASPFYPTGDKFPLVDLPYESWVQLSDRDGRRIPLEVYVDHRGVKGRWLP